LPVILTGLVVLFTGLYFWNARRAFLLELDRVVLWFSLEETKEEETRVKEILKTELDRLVGNAVDSLSLEWIEKHGGGLTPKKRKELISLMRKRIRGEVREDTIIRTNKRLATERQVRALAFFRTIKSKKLRGRLRDYEKKQTELYEEEKEKGLNNGKTKATEE